MRGRALQPAKTATGVLKSAVPGQSVHDCPLLGSGESEAGVAQGRLGMLTTEAPGDGKTGKCFYRGNTGM